MEMKIFASLNSNLKTISFYKGVQEMINIKYLVLGWAYKWHTLEQNTILFRPRKFIYSTCSCTNIQYNLQKQNAMITQSKCFKNNFLF